MDKMQAALGVIQANITKEYGSKGLDSLTVSPEKATPWQAATAAEIASTEMDPIWLEALAAQL